MKAFYNGIVCMIAAMLLAGCGKEPYTPITPLPPLETTTTTADTYTGTTVEFYHFEPDPTTTGHLPPKPTFEVLDIPQADTGAALLDTAVSADTNLLIIPEMYGIATVTDVINGITGTQLSETSVPETVTDYEGDESTETVSASITASVSADNTSEQYTFMTADTADNYSARMETGDRIYTEQTQSKPKGMLS